MENFLSARQLIEKYNGIIQAKKAVSDGSSSYMTLKRFADSGQLERIGPGIYGNPCSLEDGFAVAQLRLSRGVFFKETALYLHDLTDTTPNLLEMNFPQGVRTRSANELGVVVYHQVQSLYEMGIVTKETAYGNSVEVYDAERTLCDIIRNPNPIQDEVVGKAMRQYLRRTEKNVPKLLYYANVLRVERKMKNYLEVLL